jgi:glucan phosphorylase
MSIIGEDGEKCVRMAHLATIGSHRVNGVAAPHSRLLKETVLKDFAELWPEKFTSGVTPRRFLALANPKLTALITDALGDGWLKDLTRLSGLERFVEGAGFRERWRAVEQANEQSFAKFILDAHGLVADPATLYDVQVKRIHEYKRQHLAALYVADTYLRIKEGDTRGLVPRTYVFSGKAAPAYRMAKSIIRFINALSKTIAADADARKWLHVVFVPDFNVKNAQHIYPAADLSEQTSPKEPGLFGPLVRNLAESDPYLVLADHDSHVNAQGRVAGVGPFAGWTASARGGRRPVPPGRRSSHTPEGLSCYRGRPWATPAPIPSSPSSASKAATRSSCGGCSSRKWASASPSMACAECSPSSW